MDIHPVSCATGLYYLRILAVACFGAWTLGCASGPSYPRHVDCSMFGQTMISDVDERFVAEGFSLKPPSGENWCLYRPNSAMISFSSNGLMGTYLEEAPSKRDLGHTFAVAGMAVRLKAHAIETHEDLSSFLEQWVGQGRGGTQAGGAWYADLSPAPRFKNHSFRVAPDPTREPVCVRYDVATEERDNPHFPGWLLLMTGDGIACRHPESERMIVLVEFTERRRQGLETPGLTSRLRSEAEATLNSMELLPL